MLGRPEESAARAVQDGKRTRNLPSLLSGARTIRRPELHQLVPLADSTIYELEQRGEFPRRFFITERCVVWNLAEVEAWLDARRQKSDAHQAKRLPSVRPHRRSRRQSGSVEGD
ncbi:helix-turn-helix transcriptional regulator [Pseudorhodoplanes sp.]|uniref:helix-turn-helix transcriptional regulator n=1 Tax=Pseudorhodoplanes sp. TaxID=1934341 RepID=UPI0039C923DA